MDERNVAGSERDRSAIAWRNEPTRPLEYDVKARSLT
jgi:hypothetical protein